MRSLRLWLARVMLPCGHGIIRTPVRMPPPPDGMPNPRVVTAFYWASEDAPRFKYFHHVGHTPALEGDDDA